MWLVVCRLFVFVLFSVIRCMGRLVRWRVCVVEWVIFLVVLVWFVCSMSMVGMFLVVGNSVVSLVCSCCWWVVLCYLMVIYRVVYVSMISSV